MCMVLYLAVDLPIPLVVWDEAHPAFHVRPILADDDQLVRGQFTKPQIYDVGAHTGCACGFSYGQYELKDDADRVEDVKARASIAALRRYLTSLVEDGCEVEMFACWDGDQRQSPEQRLDVSPGFFGGESFDLPEKVAFRISRVLAD